MIKSSLTKTLLILVFSFFCFAEPSLEPLINTQFEESRKLTSREIIETALKYSLCTPESQLWTECMEKYNHLEKEVSQEYGALSQIEAAEAVLGFLYKKILSQYVEKTTCLDVTLTTGKYNCVTASLLYLALSRSLGIDCRGQECTIHAFCTVYIDGQKIDVETTNPYGFNPGSRKTVMQTEDTRRYTYVTKKYYAGRREVSEKAFATLTGKNLAADLNDEEAYDTAIPLDLSRLVFLEYDSDQPSARKDADTLITNYTTILCRRHETLNAVDYLNRYIDKYGPSIMIRKTFDNCLYNACVDYLNAGQEQEADAYFVQNKENASSQMQTRIARMIEKSIMGRHEMEVHNSIVPLFNNGRLEEARQVLTEALEYNPNSQMLKKDLNLVNRALQQ